jgi:hypothetical protein
VTHPLRREVACSSGSQIATEATKCRHRLDISSRGFVYVVIDDSLSPAFPLGDALDVFLRREDAERFIEEVRGDDPELAKPLRIEERELEAGGRN